MKIEKWEKQVDEVVDKYRERDAECDIFFKNVIDDFDKDFSILEIGSGTNYILGYLQKKGFTKLIGIEASINRVLHGVMDYPDIPTYCCYLKDYDFKYHLDVIYTYSALFLNKKDICKFIDKTTCKYFGCFENFKIVKFNVDKELKKFGYTKIDDRPVRHRGIKWFKRND